MPKQTKEKKKEIKKQRDPLKRMVTALHGARREYLDAQGAFEIQETLFKQKNKGLIERLEAATLAVALNDETLRNEMLGRFSDHKVVALAPGLDIRMRSQLQVHDAYALRQWAFENMPIALIVNLDVIRLAVVGLPDKVNGASIAEVPTPYITKDLSKTLEGIK